MQSYSRREILRTRFALTAVLLLAGAATGWASGPRIWTQAGGEDFSAGLADGVSIDARGQIVLAPTIELVARPEAPRVWAFVEGPDGTIYGSWGERGEVHAVTPDGTTRVVARLDGVAAQALAIGGDGLLYVAAGPEAAIYRVDPTRDEQSPEPWFDTGMRYVWSMVFDEGGRLWLGTGGDGRILTVDMEGRGTVVYDTPEPHVTALAAVPGGGVIAGTEGSGYVYRIAADGSVTVLLDSPQREITDVLWLDGAVIASAFGAGEGESGDSSGTSGRPAAREAAGADAAGAVYRVAADGLVETLWSSEQQGPYSLAAAGTDAVVVGTGPEGRLISLRASGDGLVADFQADQIVALARSGDGMLVATSNPGGIHRVGSAFRAEGRLVSAVHDAGAQASWGAVRWSAETPPDTGVRIETRSGNTGEPDDTWSDWAAVSEDDERRAMSAPARFVQWRATLASGRSEASPILRRVDVAFVVRNLPPRVEELTVHPGGVVYRQNSGFDDGMPFAQVPASIARRLESNGGGAGAGNSFLGRPYYVAGLRTFTWEARDPNDDAIRFELSVRGELEENWKPVASGLTERMFVLDTRRLPDGPYHARLTVSDAVDRPAGEELTGHRDSGVFVVDNTAPVLSDVAVGPAPARTLTAVARDGTSLIEALEYSVDGGAWRTVRPRDGVADAAREEISVPLGELGAGEHTVVVRVVDTAQNVATDKVVFVVDAMGEVESR
jgi:sugar lactone lactonase YvrE